MTDRMLLPAYMNLGKHRFSDLNTVIDRVHEIFAAWENEYESSNDPEDLMLHRTKLAVHEWLANLVQHANFRGRNPEIVLEISPNGRSVHCVIEDNSSGFDLDAQLAARVLNACPERGMGLLMLKSCTDKLTYEKVKEDTFRLEFVVTAHQDPWLNIPF